MRIYIDKDFLENFYIDWDKQNPNNEQLILYKILTEYPETTWFYEGEIKSESDIDMLKENPIFAKKADTFLPDPVDSIKEELFQSDFEQELILMAEQQDWFEDAELKGALCFSYDNYQDKIRDFKAKHTFKIDLSDTFVNWDKFEIDFPINNIIINDGFILSDKDNQRIKKNIIPLLKKFRSKYFYSHKKHFK